MVHVFQAFVITLREGLERFSSSPSASPTCAKSGARQFIPAVHWGSSWPLASAARRLPAVTAPPTRSGSRARWLAAAVSVTWMVVHMWRTAGDEGRHRRATSRSSSSARVRPRHGRLPVHAADGEPRGHGNGAAPHATARDGALSAWRHRSAWSAPRAVAWLWSRYGQRVNLGLFFQVTAIFLLVFVVQLLIRGTTRCPSRACCRIAR